jgi:phosphatidylserine/phosphatidylglycerophosphate/cardiolipin synthase-like enzyme
MNMQGLASLTRAELEALHELISRERLRCPISPTRLAAVGLAHAWADLGVLHGAAREHALALLEVALAERRHARSPQLDLVWTGPETARSSTRSTAIVLREMFERARRSVVIAGFSFDHTEQIFAPLHAVMREHGVRVRMFVHVAQDAVRESDAESALRTLLTNQARHLWPFGPPEPDIFHDARVLDRSEWLSLHAKCVVVDERETLLTSANFTERAHERNVEMGVHVLDMDFAGRVAAHWHSLVVAGLMIPLSRTT